LAIQQNIQKARKKWGRFGKLLCGEGAKEPETMAKFYLAIVQAVLLYGADTWIVSKRAHNRLRSFHHHCARYITRRHIRKDENNEWICSCPASAEVVLEQAGLKTIDEYIKKRNNTPKQALCHLEGNLSRM
jgi:hypothetical protein